MPRTMKTLSALATLMALVPTTAPGAYTVGSPLAGTVRTTTYYSSGAFHGAVDISNGPCGTNPITTGVVGSLSWNVTLRTTGIACDMAGGTQNEAAHTFADGYTFRLLQFNKSANSYDRTCDRCSIGIEGPDHIHLQRDRNGTNITTWYSGYTTVGEFLSLGETVGVF
ncbi:hypothetical protein [Archangium sp.]|uniref:hypothetical protein n=1 Tax=Archangium sp. TaxID=1872627 RepID=UPI002D620F5D|nr:hypothetical protein [Archangium sp.]HYO53019.1 hypothetical protein [Archangium sp.]